MINGTVNAEQRCENFSLNMWVGLNYDKLIGSLVHALN